jgi:hypothetical protein
MSNRSSIKKKKLLRGALVFENVAISTGCGSFTLKATRKLFAE